jgi:hypothetical protein
MIGSMVTGVEWKGNRIPCRLIIFDKDGTLVDGRTKGVDKAPISI